MKPDRFKKAAKVAELAQLEEEGSQRGIRRRAQLELQDWIFIAAMGRALNERKTGRLSDFSAELVRPWDAMSDEQRKYGFSCGYGYLR